MNFQLIGKNIELTGGIKVYLTHKINKVFKNTKQHANLSLSLCVEKKRHIAHAILSQNRVTLFAADETKDLYASANNVLNKIAKHLNKQNARSQNKKISK